MAIASVSTLGTALSTANNQTSLVLTTTTVAEVGRLVVVAVAVDNAQTTDGNSTAVSSITDSAGGNTWTRAKGHTSSLGVAQDGADISIWYSVLNNQIANGGTITATFANSATSDASAMSAWKYSLAISSQVAIEGTPSGLSNDASNAGSLNVTTANVQCLRFRAIASESSSTTALTASAGWTLISQAISGAGVSATEMGVRGEFIISTATGAASAPTGGAGAVDHASAYVAFREIVPQDLTPALYTDGESFGAAGVNRFLTPTLYVDSDLILTPTLTGLGATIPWEGGSAYWSQFAKADAAGWSDPSFFPIAVFLVKPEGFAGHGAALAALGVNVAMAVEHQTPISDLTDHMFVLANPDNPYTSPAEEGWDTSEIGSDPNVVGWFLCDEPDIGLGGFIGTDDEFGWLAALQALAATSRGLSDGRFVFTNFSNGIYNTFWSTNTFFDMVAEVDASSVDMYAYTRPSLNVGYGQSVEWTDLGGTEANSISSAAYGWQAMRMGFYQPAVRKPYWVFVETKMPYLDEVGSRVILYAQIEGAVWSAIVNEARGVAYFQHNGFYPGGLPVNDPNTGAAHCEAGYSLVECEQGLRDAVTAINAKIASLAPVINTQSRAYSWGASGISTMTKLHGGFIYLFASVGIAATTGSKTFTLPSLATGTAVEVIGESRSVSISGGSFSDSFPNEYTHHVYRILTTEFEGLLTSLYVDAEVFFTPTVTFDTTTSQVQVSWLEIEATEAGLLILPELYVDGDIFYAATLTTGTVNLAPNLYADGDIFFTPKITLYLVPALYVDAETFFTQTVTAGAGFLAPNLYIDPDAFFTHVLSVGAAPLTPALYVDAENFFTHTITTGALTLAPALYVDNDVFFTHSVTTGVVTLLPNLYVDNDVFFTPKLTLYLTPSLYTDNEVFFGPSLTVTILPNLYADNDVFFTQTIVGASALLPNLYVDNDVFFTHTITSGLTLLPALYIDNDVFFTHTITSTLAPALYTDNEVFFTHTVTAGVATLLPSLYADNDVFFGPIVSTGAGQLIPQLHVDTDVFFTHVISAGAITLVPSLYVDNDVFFTHTLTTTRNLSPALYTDNDIFFTHTLSAGAPVQSLNPALYVDNDVFFTHTITLYLTPALFTDPDIFYLATLGGGLAPALYADNDNFFTHTVTTGAVNLAPTLYVDADIIFTHALGIAPPHYNDPNIFYFSKITYILQPDHYLDNDIFYPPAISQLYLLVPSFYDDTDIFYQQTLTGGFHVPTPPDRTVVAQDGRPCIPVSNENHCVTTSTPSRRVAA